MEKLNLLIKKYGIIVFMSFLLLITALLFIKIDNNYEDQPFAILIKTNKNNQFIELYKDETDDTYFMFLPSYANNKNTKLRLLTTYPVYLDDMRLKEGMKLDELILDHEYSLKVNGKQIGNVTFMQSSNIPSVFIATSKRDLSFLMEDKNNIDEGTISFIDAEGNIEYSGDLDSISGRGNQSWTFDKRGWSLRLFKEVPLFGMRSSYRWNLIANVCDDTVGLRNKAAHYLAEKLDMEYVSKQQFVDLYIDSLYYGTYQLVEKIEEKEDKLDIGDLDTRNYLANGFILDTDLLERYTEYYDELPYRSYSIGVSSPDDISGGYIIERNNGFKLKDKEHLFTTSRNEPFIVRYPSVVNEEELDYINDTVQTVEDALFAEDYIDQKTSKGIWELADMDSFVKKFLVDEFSKNEGAGVTSSYFYKKQGDDKLYGGPVWDFDKSFGNCGVWKEYEGLSLGKLFVNPITYWYERLYENKEANDLIKEYYSDIIKSGCKEITETMIDQWSKEIKDSYKMNKARWKYITNADPDFYDNLDVLYHFDEEEAKQYLKSWINNRITYLDGIWENGEVQ